MDQDFFTSKITLITSPLPKLLT